MTSQAEKTQCPIKFPINLVDGKVIEIEVDSLCTSQDLCGEVARKIDLLDAFGFSLYVSSYEKVGCDGMEICVC